MSTPELVEAIRDQRIQANERRLIPVHEGVPPRIEEALQLDIGGVKCDHDSEFQGE